MSLSAEESARLEEIAQRAHTEEPPSPSVLCADIGFIVRRLALTERGGRDGLADLEDDDLYRLHHVHGCLLSHLADAMSDSRSFAQAEMVAECLRNALRWQSVSAFTEAAFCARERGLAATAWDDRAMKFEKLGFDIRADLDRKYAQRLRDQEEAGAA